MAILVMQSPLPSEPFVAALKRVAPEIPVWFSEQAHDAAAVEAMLAWRIQPGAIARYPGLRVLCAIGAGVDKLLSAPDLPPGLPVTRTVDLAQDEQIAQYVVACTLRHTRDLLLYAQQQAAAAWQRHRVRAPDQCRVGVLGLGSVGQAIARAFLPLGYPVAGWSRGGRAVPGVTVFAGADGLAALLAQSDVLVCALPLTAATHGLLNHQALRQLPRNGYVVNVGRGEHLVEADLRALLDSGHLAGAALDVFQREPPLPDNWVWSHPKVLATPHIAGEVGRDAVARQVVEALRCIRAGQPPPHAVDRSAGY